MVRRNRRSSYRRPVGFENSGEYVPQPIGGRTLDDSHQRWLPAMASLRGIFEGRILTSFEGKALKAGRLVFDLAYTRAG